MEGAATGGGAAQPPDGIFSNEICYLKVKAWVQGPGQKVGRDRGTSGVGNRKQQRQPCLGALGGGRLAKHFHGLLHARAESLGALEQIEHLGLLHLEEHARDLGRVVAFN